MRFCQKCFLLPPVSLTINVCVSGIPNCLQQDEDDEEDFDPEVDEDDDDPGEVDEEDETEDEGEIIGGAVCVRWCQ